LRTCTGYRIRGARRRKPWVLEDGCARQILREDLARVPERARFSIGGLRKNTA